MQHATTKREENEEYRVFLTLHTSTRKFVDIDNYVKTESYSSYPKCTVFLMAHPLQG